MPAASETRQIRAIARGLERFAERAVIKVTLDFTKAIQQANPVDTGWSRANWVPAVGSPRTDPVGSRPGSGESFTDVAASASGSAQVLGYKLTGGAVFVSNNVPYISRLNERGAVRARNSVGQVEGPGFVQRSIEQAVRAAQTLRP